VGTSQAGVRGSLRAACGGRESFLEEACGEELALRNEVESLLAARFEQERHALAKLGTFLRGDLDGS